MGQNKRDTRRAYMIERKKTVLNYNYLKRNKQEWQLKKNFIKQIKCNKYICVCKDSM